MKDSSAQAQCCHLGTSVGSYWFYRLTERCRRHLLHDGSVLQVVATLVTGSWRDTPRKYTLTITQSVSSSNSNANCANVNSW